MYEISSHKGQYWQIMVFDGSNSVQMCVRRSDAYSLRVPRSFHCKYVDSSFYSWGKTGRVYHAAEGEGEEWVRSSLLMREHGIIFCCLEADELRMLDQRRTIWDNDTV